MNLLMLKGQFLVKDVKRRVIKTFSNRRGDDNANDGGKGSVKILGLVVLGGLILTILGVGVAYINGGLVDLKGIADKIKALVPTTP